MIKVSKDYNCPGCGKHTPDWEPENEYKGKNGEEYPKIISHNKKIGDIVLLNFSGEYSSYDWTEIHYCNDCEIEYQFENSNC